MRTRIWHSDWKPRWLIRCVSAALLSFMDKQVTRCVFEKTAATRLRELWHVRRCVSVPDSRREAVESLDKKIREDFV